jgi:hypothetical protein
MYKLFTFIILIFCISCSSPTVTQYIKREFTIWNYYESNGYDNYNDEVGVNFRFEQTGWLWYYTSGNRPMIQNNDSRKWTFYIPENEDSVYINVRFFYQRDIDIKIIDADTTIRLNEDKVFKFWNCGDSTATQYPFPACLTKITKTS